MKDKKIYIIIAIIILFIVLVIVVLNKILTMKPINSNKVLNTNQYVDLMKYSSYYLNTSKTLEEGSISDEAMVGFSFAYILVLEKDTDIEFDYQEYLAKISIDRINNISEYIFNTKPNYNNVSYKIENQYIYVPILPTLGDTQIYKYNSEIFDKNTNTYVAYIDVLESSVSEISDLRKDTNISYDKDYVISQLQFKYRIVNNRKILTSFNVENNW